MSSRRQFLLDSVRAAALARMVGTRGFAQSPRETNDYTPFGYLDNPYHCWNLHRSGILRSVAGIGFDWFFPAGPGGYFDWNHNGIYVANLKLGLQAAGKRYWELADFAAGAVRSIEHTKNVFTYEVTVPGAKMTATFVQVEENALGAYIEVTGAATLIVGHEHRLGPAQWWGGDGVTARYDGENDALVSHSFAAGAVFSVTADKRSVRQSIPKSVAYKTDPVSTEMQFEHARQVTVLLLRGENELVQRDKPRVMASLPSAIRAKREEDERFWREAPWLVGDWPQHWKNGWHYDFETLRMNVRRPVGVYKHRWDGMQIQAPRNVLAETSIDMFALSYANPETAKEVLLGQYLDALADNIPCMREDGEMNMVASDGSECGTSISWCYPYFCAWSVFERTGDAVWLRELYPRLVRLFDWTVKNRSDRDGFLVGKCSWETGMDSSRRFLIEQPTGAELTENIRIVELQAAACQAADILARMSRALETEDLRWTAARTKYREKTQALWNGQDWFHDFDSHSGKLLGSIRDLGQVGAIFTGAATSDQASAMLPTMRGFLAKSRSSAQGQTVDWEDGLQWSSLVLPFLESAWTAGDHALAAETIQMICERVWSSTDRRDLRETDHSRLGWPGVSCEVWGAHGAFGGEGYGWGAVLPAHVIRSIVGWRETELRPNLPESMMRSGARFGIEGLRYRNAKFSVEYEVKDRASLRVRVRGDAVASASEVKNRSALRLHFRS